MDRCNIAICGIAGEQTLAALLTSDGRIVATASTGPLHVHMAPTGMVAREIFELCKQLAITQRLRVNELIPTVGRVVVCLSGASLRHESTRVLPEMVRESVSIDMAGIELTCLGDADAAFAANAQTPQGIAISITDGLLVLAKKGDASWTFDGRGLIADGFAGTYSLGREALSIVCRARDDRRQECPALWAAIHARLKTQNSWNHLCERYANVAPIELLNQYLWDLMSDRSWRSVVCRMAGALVESISEEPARSVLQRASAHVSQAVKDLMGRAELPCGTTVTIHGHFIEEYRAYGEMIRGAVKDVGAQPALSFDDGFIAPIFGAMAMATCGAEGHHMTARAAMTRAAAQPMLWTEGGRK